MNRIIMELNKSIIFFKIFNSIMIRSYIHIGSMLILYLFYTNSLGNYNKDKLPYILKIINENSFMVKKVFLNRIKNNE